MKKQTNHMWWSKKTGLMLIKKQFHPNVKGGFKNLDTQRTWLEHFLGLNPFVFTT